MNRYPGAQPHHIEGAWDRGTTHMVIDLAGVQNEPWTALRVKIIADVLRRILEDLWGEEVTTFSQRPNTHNDITHNDWPPGTGRTGPRCIRIAASDCPPDPCGRVITVATGSASIAFDVRGNVPDPYAVRLALLRFLPISTAALTVARLHRADQTLQRWRSKVAGWAEMPPGPSLDADFLGRSLISDLDTAALLTRLHRLEVDHAVASGTKFATFARVDHVLGLDLCRIVLGRYHTRGAHR